MHAWQDIQSFTFSPNSTHLILRRRAPVAPGAAGRTGGAAEAPAGGGGGAGGAAAAADPPAGPRGVDVIVRTLSSGRDQLLGSVGDISFNKAGDLLAYTVDASVRDTNGLFVLDLRNGRMNALDNDARVYNRLTWNDDGTALAVLKGTEVERMRERDNVLFVVPERAGRARRCAGTDAGRSSIRRRRPDSPRAGW